MKRVLPRDAFNDANLLKCIGQLTLLIHDGKCCLTVDYDGEPFDIQQNTSDGSTWVTNIRFFTPSGELVRHMRSLNSREDWPLMLLLDNPDSHEDDEFYAFDSKGNFMPSFENK
jgi:hypothetical protein